MKHKLSTIAFAQGWLENQIEREVNRTAGEQNEDPTAHLLATQMQEQWNIINTSLDELVRLNQILENKLEVIRSLFL